MSAVELAEVVVAVIATGGAMFTLVRLALRGVRRDLHEGFATNKDEHAVIRVDHKELRTDQIEHGKAIVRLETLIKKRVE